MRIALVTHQFFPAFYTGVERLTLNLAKQLGRMGHVAIVVTSAAHSGDIGRDDYEFEGVRVRTVAAGPIDLARPWAQSQRTMLALKHVLNEEKIDVVDVMHAMRLPQTFEAAARLDIPTVAHVADYAYLCARVNMLRPEGELCISAEDGVACARACRIRSGPERVEWGRTVLAHAQAVICPCRFTIELHRANGFAIDDWHHIPWGVDYGLFPTRLEAPSKERVIVGFAGTLLRHKGPHVLIEAVAKRPDLEAEVRLWGESFHEDDYGRRLRELAGDDPRISFRGRYDHDEFSDLLAGLDALVIPSLWHENLPTTGLNAVAAGVPLLVSDVGGLAELVSDYACGFTFPTANQDALADLLVEFSHDRRRLEAVRASIVYPPPLEEEAWRIEQIYRRVIRE